MSKRSRNGWMTVTIMNNGATQATFRHLSVLLQNRNFDDNIVTHDLTTNEVYATGRKKTKEITTVREPGGSHLSNFSYNFYT